MIPSVKDVLRRVPRLVLVVPFDGEREVFMYQANTYNGNPARVAELNAQDLHIAIENPDSNPPRPAPARTGLGVRRLPR